MEFDQELKLREDFEPPSLEEWREAVEQNLKGADFDKVMHTKTHTGITLKPIYTRRDTQDLPFIQNQPGTPPYVRGNDPKRFLTEGWLIAQSQDEPDLKKLNEQILRELNLGLTAVNIALKHPDSPRGVKISSLEDLRVVLQGIDLKAAPLFAQLDVDDCPVLGWLEQYAAEKGLDLKELEAGVGFDPTGEFARKGYVGKPLEEFWAEVVKWVRWGIEKAPKNRLLSLDGTVYEAAGASEVQELGFVLSTGIGLIQGLQHSGFEFEQLAPLFQARLSLGSNFFMEIARIRAFRLLWAEAAKAFGGSEDAQRIWIHGKTASFNKSLYDRYVNVLRTSTESFSGVMGGVDSLETGCFNELTEEPGEFARRIARNQQIILREEAHFGKVMDPAGGCYYIESLTHELATKAWKLMQELEAAGGMVRCLRSGRIHEMIEATAGERIAAVRKRKDVFVGVNMYADPQEKIAPTDMQSTASVPPEAVKLEQGALPRRRAMEDVEKLRSRIQSSPVNKKIYLINIGSLAEYKARTDFAAGFFPVGGLEVVSGAGFTDVREAVETARKSQAAAFCLCSTDANYERLVPELCALMPDETIILAGYPRDKAEEYKKLGIDVFIHARADVVETLDELAKLLGVEK